MMSRKPGKDILALACIALVFGIVITARRSATWYSSQQISGGAAIAVGVLNIILSIYLFVTYFKRKQ